MHWKMLIIKFLSCFLTGLDPDYGDSLFDPLFSITESSLLYFTAVFRCIHLIMCITTWWERMLASWIGENTINLYFKILLKNRIWEPFFSLEDVHIHSLWFFVLPLFSTYKFQGSRSTWQWKVLSWDVSWNRREGF